MLAVTSDPRSVSPAWHPFPSQSRVQAFLANTQTMPWGSRALGESFGISNLLSLCPKVLSEQEPLGHGLCQPESPPVEKDYIWKSSKPNLNPGFSTDYWVIWGQSFDLFGKTEITPVLSSQLLCVFDTMARVKPFALYGAGVACNNCSCVATPASVAQ